MILEKCSNILTTTLLIANEICSNYLIMIICEITKWTDSIGDDVGTQKTTNIQIPILDLHFGVNIYYIMIRTFSKKKYNDADCLIIVGTNIKGTS